MSRDIDPSHTVAMLAAYSISRFCDLSLFTLLSASEKWFVHAQVRSFEHTFLFGVLFKFQEKCVSKTKVWHQPTAPPPPTPLLPLTSIWACGAFAPLGGGRFVYVCVCVYCKCVWWGKICVYRSRWMCVWVLGGRVLQKTRVEQIKTHRRKWAPLALLFPSSCTHPNHHLPFWHIHGA